MFGIVARPIRCCAALLAIAWGGGLAFGAEDPELAGKPLSKWLKQLESENRGLQLRAAKALAEAPAETHAVIVPQLLPFLGADRENTRLPAAQIMGDFGPAARAAVPLLLPLLEGTQFERNRAAAAKSLGQILKDAPPSEEVEQVVLALTRKIDEAWDSYSDVRREAARALGMIGPAAKSAIPKLTKVLIDHVGQMGSQYQEHLLARRAAAWTLGRMGPLAAEHMDRLISMMQTEGQYNPEIVEAIGCIGPLNPNVISNIMDKIESTGRPGDCDGFKVPAFAALARFGAKAAPAVPLIRRMLRDTTGDTPLPIKTAMVKTLAAIGPEAKVAAPEILAQVRLATSQGGNSAYAALKVEAESAYKALLGEAPPPPEKTR